MTGRLRSCRHLQVSHTPTTGDNPFYYTIRHPTWRFLRIFLFSYCATWGLGQAGFLAFGGLHLDRSGTLAGEAVKHHRSC